MRGRHRHNCLCSGSIASIQKTGYPIAVILAILVTVRQAS
jgi:hypothetical protein